MQSRDNGHGEICSVDDVVDMVYLVGRLKQRILNGVDGRVVYRHARIMVFDIMASVAEWRFNTSGRFCITVS